jgi:hypothetical protein
LNAASKNQNSQPGNDHSIFWGKGGRSIIFFLFVCLKKKNKKNVCPQMLLKKKYLELKVAKKNQ